MPRRLVEVLDTPVAHRVSGALPGDRMAAGLGVGTELAQLRPYEPGDDVRHIDAAATARTGEPYVRLHVPERTLTTWLVVDVSPSMAFGTANRLKSDVAEGVAVVMARLAVRRAGRVALLTFGAGESRLLRPRAARPGVLAVRKALADGVAPDGRSEPDALARALNHIRKVAGQSGLVVVVSDFRDQHDWTRPLGAVGERHSTVAVEVRDPRESEVPAVGRLALVDPETGERVEVDTSRRVVRERFASIEAERRDGLADAFRRLRAHHVVLSTGEDWLRELGRRLH
ncbi:MAG: hypothetical protein QOE06_174 [Thermoleophilaceae bacterium]|jgi:uncharacterized protein (DUF58 family)|nr:hypothetical protein [Thermoleophilaceae bacterium]